MGIGILAPMLLLLPLFLFRANRCAKAWWIWVPVGVTVLAGTTLVFLLADSEPSVERGVCAFITGLAAVWLLMPYLNGRYRIVTFFKTLLLLAGFSLLAFVPSFLASEVGWIDFRPFLAIYLAVMSLAATLALVFTGRSVRRRFGRVRFVYWLAVWTMVTWAAMTTPFLIYGLLTHDVEWGAGSLTMLCFSAITVASLLPLVLLSFFQPFYQARFFGFLKIPQAGVAAESVIPPKLPEIDQPTQRPAPAGATN
jgi:hypothetical protein